MPSDLRTVHQSARQVAAIRATAPRRSRPVPIASTATPRVTPGSAAAHTELEAAECQDCHLHRPAGRTCALDEQQQCGWLSELPPAAGGLRVDQEVRRLPQGGWEGAGASLEHRQCSRRFRYVYRVQLSHDRSAHAAPRDSQRVQDVSQHLRGAVNQDLQQLPPDQSAHSARAVSGQLREHGLSSDRRSRQAVARYAREEGLRVQRVPRCVGTRVRPRVVPRALREPDTRRGRSSLRLPVLPQVGDAVSSRRR